MNEILIRLRRRILSWQVERDDVRQGSGVLTMFAATSGRTCALLSALSGLLVGLGSVAATATVAVPAGHGAGWHFTKPYAIPHLRDAVNGLACPTSHECIAVSSNRVFWTTNVAGGKKHWHNAALEPLQQSGVVGGDVILDEVSCGSPHLCVAVDDIGQAFVSSHPTGGKSAWQRVPVSGIELLGVGCSSSGTCAAVDYNGAVYSTTHPLGAWTRGTRTVGANADFYGVSCAGSSLCAVVDDSAHIATTTSPGSATWHLATAKGSGWADISCPTVHKCVAVGGAFTHGKVAMSTNPGAGHWKHSTLGREGASKIDCASASSCFVLSDYASSHASAKKSAWHPVSIKGLGSQTAVSCPSPKRCFIGTSIDQFTAGH